MARKSLRLDIAVLSCILIAVAVVGANENHLFETMGMSLTFAVLINGVVSFATGLTCGALKWGASCDASETSALFGVKIGLYVFAALVIISLILMHFKQPPTRAPVVAVAVPWYAVELMGCILEPIFWVCELFGWDLSRKSPKQRGGYGGRNRRGGGG